MGYLIGLVVVLVLIWLLLVRPQRRRQVQHAELLSQLEVGDEVLTAGGLYGRVRAIADEQVTLEIAPGTEVKVEKRAVAGVVEQPELETTPSDES